VCLHFLTLFAPVLQVNIHVPEHAWRSGHGLRPYIRDAQRLLSKAHATKDATITQQKIDFLHLPIIDGSVTTDTAMHRLAEDCCERVLRGERLYIHCWGGHGRTGESNGSNNSATSQIRLSD
jgi:hypothetical protein